MNAGARVFSGAHSKSVLMGIAIIMALGLENSTLGAYVKEGAIGCLGEVVEGGKKRAEIAKLYINININDSQQ